MANPAMEQLLQIRRIQEQSQRDALNEVVEQSQENLKRRIAMAAQDPAINIEQKQDEDKD